MPNKEIDLRRFLAEQGQEGRLDSQGEFTIDSDKAARKLAGFSLPHDYAWVLKLMQAAVTWESESLRVTQSKLYSSFVFEPALHFKLPTARDIVRTVLEGGLEDKAPLQRLCMALRSLVEQTGLSFVVGVKDGERLEAVFAGPDTSSLDPSTRQSWGALRRARGIRVTVSHQREGEYYLGRYAPKFLLHQRRDVAVAEQLVQNALASPVSVSLDGRALNSPFLHPDLGFSSGLRPFFSSGIRTEEASEVVPLSSDFTDLIIPVLAPPSRILEARGPSGPVRAWVFWRVMDPEVFKTTLYTEREARKHRRRPLVSEALWVQDGVIVERKRLRLQTFASELTLLINAAGLETDLSGLALQETEEKEERFQRAFQDAQDLLERSKEKIAAYSRWDSELLTEDETLQLRRLAHKKIIKKSAMGLPILAWNPFLGLGLVAGGLALHGVNKLFPNTKLHLEQFEAYQKALNGDLRAITQCKVHLR